MFSDDYTGIPFKPDGRERDALDCWGLVRLVYLDHLDIVLPSYPGAYPDQSRESAAEAARVAAEEQKHWERVDPPRPYDVVLLRAGGLPCHVGVVVSNTEMLHIMAGIESCVEKFTGPHWKNRVEGFFHYAR